MPSVWTQLQSSTSSEAYSCYVVTHYFVQGLPPAASIHRQARSEHIRTRSKLYRFPTTFAESPRHDCSLETIWTCCRSFHVRWPPSVLSISLVQSRKSQGHATRALTLTAALQQFPLEYHTDKATNPGDARPRLPSQASSPENVKDRTFWIFHWQLRVDLSQSERHTTVLCIPP